MIESERVCFVKADAASLYNVTNGETGHKSMFTVGRRSHRINVSVAHLCNGTFTT